MTPWPAPPRVVGRRGVVLLFLALLDFVYALSLCRPAPSQLRAPTTVFLASVAPLHVFAWAWLTVGILCLAGAFGRRRWSALDVWPFLAAIVIKVFWGTLLGLGWALGAVERGWVSAAVWVALAVLVITLAGWPEPGDEA